ncbi:MAG: universal stress protein [Candidatus Methanoperedens sp.]|nr:universal stress protein [Candidatus Methanoperedens sp.]
MAGKSIKKILIATDGSDYTKRAVEYGIEIAKSTGAKLYAIYVIDTRAYDSLPESAPIEYAYLLLRKEGEIATEYVADRARAIGMEAEKIITEGHPAEEIIKYAEENSIDLIVMGTFGKGGVNRLLLGSVASKVIRTSKIPVLVVPIRDVEL